MKKNAAHSCENLARNSGNNEWGSRGQEKSKTKLTFGVKSTFKKNTTTTTLTGPVSPLLHAAEQLSTTNNLQSNWSTKKLLVDFPLFTGLEHEDVHEFIDNDKRASLFLWKSGSNLVLGLPMYLKGYASDWFWTFEGRDGTSFDELSFALIRHSSFLVNKKELYTSLFFLSFLIKHPKCLQWYYLLTRYKNLKHKIPGIIYS